jgi:chromosome segregation ATPase
MEKKDMLNIQKFIDKSTSKVSLRDLEKKGFRSVKVLKANDIHDLIRKAVDAVLARQEGFGAKDRDRVIKESRREFNKMIKETQEARLREAKLDAERNALASKVEDLSRRLTSELADKKRLDTRVEEFSKQLIEERKERRGLEEKLEEFREKAELGGGSKELKDRHEKLLEQFKTLQMEKRLLEELEIPKLKDRIGELNEELKAEHAARGGEDRLEAMFQHLVLEMQKRQNTSDMSAIQKEIARMSERITDQMSRTMVGPEGRPVDGAQMAEVSLRTLFEHPLIDDVESNIDAIQVKEKTAKPAKIKDSLKKLKSLRKGGKDAK